MLGRRMLHGSNSGPSARANQQAIRDSGRATFCTQSKQTLGFQIAGKLPVDMRCGYSGVPSADRDLMEIGNNVTDRIKASDACLLMLVDNQTALFIVLGTE